MAATGEPDAVDGAEAEITARLTGVPDTQWAAIAAALEDVLAEEEHLTWEGGERIGSSTVDGAERPVLRMWYPVYSDAVERLRDLLSVFAVPFPWPTWDGLARYRHGNGLAEAPVGDAVRMITAVLRSERFTDGSIEGAIKDGTLGAAVRRVLEWRRGPG